MNHSRLSRLFFCFFLVLIATNISLFSADAKEKPIPDQSVLDKCFAGGFSMDKYTTTSYTDVELKAMDRALAAVNMTRKDLEFQKDYTDAHLAFPLILDMMKYPLHIAPYMDGFANSIEALRDNEVFYVPDVLASAMVHPGIDVSKVPSWQLILDETRLIENTGSAPWNLMKTLPLQQFNYVLESMALSEIHAKSALSKLTKEELAILRENLPSLMAWRDAVKSPYPEAEKKRIEELMKDKPAEYLDELATKIDLTDMLIAYAKLPNPRYLVSTLKPSDFPQDKPAIYETPWGRMALGTPGNDSYTGDFAIIIEPGGNDVYTDCMLGSALGLDNSRVGFFLDMGGNDVYLCQDKNLTLGASVMGVASFYDLGNGKDLFQSGSFSMGATGGGIASFFDDGGNDSYSTKIYGQGAAGYGIAVMVDSAPPKPTATVSPANEEDAPIDESLIQNNRFEAWSMAQGFSRQWGVGVCHGARGNDVYHAGSVSLHAPLFNDRYQSYSQGFSIGSREIDYAGGIAFIIDDDGNDYYLGDIYNQGVGYWYSGGFLLDKAGNDHYEMTQYGQGSGIHLAVGGIIDNAGNDSYVMNSGLGQGGSHDFAASVMMDRGGIDRYMGSTSSNGCGLTNSVGLFFDRSGDDIYGVNPDACTLGGGRPERNTGSIGVFVDTGGADFYVGIAHDNRLWTQTTFGTGIDVKQEDVAQGPAQGQVDQPPATNLDIPKIVFYEGEFTDEVFNELWEIAVRWEVGDNRVFTPKARERLIKFGKVVIPKIDEKFDDTLGLAYRAYEVILPALYKDSPEEVKAMLEKNLKSDNEARIRNAMSLIGVIKITDMDKLLVPFLDNEKLRGGALTTLGTLGSRIADDKIKSFLAPDQGERLILLAATTLLKLGNYDIYPELRNLLDHQYFTVREGIIMILGANYDKFHTFVYQDLKNEKLDRTTHISLLRVLARYPEFFPSQELYNVVNKDLDNSDWVVRSNAVEALKYWQTYKGEQWKRMQDTIEDRFEKMKKTETDFHILYLLNDK